LSISFFKDSRLRLQRLWCDRKARSEIVLAFLALFARLCRSMSAEKDFLNEVESALPPKSRSSAAAPCREDLATGKGLLCTDPANGGEFVARPLGPRIVGEFQPEVAHGPGFKACRLRQ